MNNRDHFTLTSFFSFIWKHMSYVYHFYCFPLWADLSWMANIGDRPSGWWNTRTHTVGRWGAVVWWAGEYFFLHRMEALERSRWLEIQHTDLKREGAHYQLPGPPHLTKSSHVRTFSIFHLPALLAHLPVLHTHVRGSSGSPRRLFLTPSPSASFVLRKWAPKMWFPPPPLVNECTKQQQFPSAGIASCCSRLQLISTCCRETAHTMPSLWFPHCFLWFWCGAPQWQNGGGGGYEG